MAAPSTDKIRKYILWGVLALVALLAPAKVAVVFEALSTAI